MSPTSQPCLDSFAVYFSYTPCLVCMEYYLTRPSRTRGRGTCSRLALGRYHFTVFTANDHLVFTACLLITPEQWHKTFWQILIDPTRRNRPYFHNKHRYRYDFALFEYAMGSIVYHLHVSIAMIHGVVVRRQTILRYYQIHAFLLYYHAKWLNSDINCSRFKNNYILLGTLTA